MYKSVGPDDIHLRVLKELADVVAKPLFIVFEKMRLSGKDPGDCKKRNIAPISREGRKEDLGNYGLPQQPIVGCLCLGRAWSRSSWKKR